MPSNPPGELSVSGITHESATISWTVTSLSYGPETYVVQYGTDMSTLDQTSSSMQTSGPDITLIDFTRSISLTGLQLTTTYYYRVIATNGGGGMTPSVTGTFNTSGLG